MDLRVVAEGPGWRVVGKPTGVAVHRSAMVPDRDTVMRWARGRFGPGVSPVHRLDRATSGCLLLSDGAAWTEPLQTALTNGQKWYVALVRGRVASMDPVRFQNPMKDPDGVVQDATTVLIPVAASSEPRCSLVLAIPETGRWHQIRRHLRDLSHPVVGDSSHGDTRVNRAFREEFGLGRLALHCLRLSLPGGVEAVCGLPADLRSTLERMPWWDEARERLPLLDTPWAAA